MKKLSIFLLALTLILVGCGDSNKEAGTKTNEDTKVESVSENKEETKEETKEENKNEKAIEHNGSIYEITKAEIIENKMFPEKKILALHLKFTNNSKENINIWMDNPFKAEQETDATVELLNGANGQFPEDYHPDLVKNGDDLDIKPGATVEAIIGYDIIDPKTPVYIRPMFNGDFEFVYNK